MPISLLPVIRARFFDAAGVPLAGGKVYTYDAGTTTPKDSYTDSTGGTPNANPVILDAAGEADIWLDGFYHVVVDDANDVQQYDTDNVSSSDYVPDASDTVAGRVRFATLAEHIAGVIDDAASNPAGTAAQTRFDILPAKTTLDSADFIAITDSLTGDDNAVVTYSDLLTNLTTDLAIGGGGGGGGTPIALTGMLVDRGYAEYLSQADLTAIIPQDNTIPQFSEGTNILEVKLTPKKVTNIFRVRFAGTHNPSSLGTSIAALFVDGASNPDAVRVVTGQSANNNKNMGNNIVMEYEFVPNTLAEVSMQINVGARAGNYSMNDAALANYGSVQACTLIVDELDPLAQTFSDPFVLSDITGVTGADRIINMISLTQAEYDAITPVATTLYIIDG